MRVAGALVGVLAVAACGPASPDPTTINDRRVADVGGGGTGDGDAAGAARELAAAIAAETEALAALDVDVARAEDALDTGGAAAEDALLTLRADRVARRAHLRHLERCAAELVPCPPRLDEPTVPATWDAATQTLGGAFTADAAGFPAAAAELAAAACACRTQACAQWTLADLARWEDALPLPDQDAAAEDVTLARSCAYARLGSE